MEPLAAAVTRTEGSRGAPTFVWLAGDPRVSEPSLAGATTATLATGTLKLLAPTLGLGNDALAAASLVKVDALVGGGRIAKFEQKVDGIEVFRRSASLVLDANDQPVALSGLLAQDVSPAKGAQGFVLESGHAATFAYQASLGKGVNARVAQPKATGTAEGGYTTFRVEERNGTFADTRAKKVYFEEGSGLVPAWYVEVKASSNDSVEGSLKSFVVAADDGRVLFENLLEASEAFSYRVYADGNNGRFPWDSPLGNTATPHPTGRPDGLVVERVPEPLVSLGSLDFSKQDPWLASTATELVGNNANAYADLTSPDGMNAGDIRPTATAPRTFDYSTKFEENQSSPANIKAATTHLFYVANFLHDWFYDAGWDETSANPQQDNYGRGGVSGDPLLMEAQDSSGRNNANAQTPADGQSPRIQMYLFDGRPQQYFGVRTTGTAQGRYLIGLAAFGAQTYGLEGVLASVTTDACSALPAAADVSGKIAIVDDGGCEATVKATNLQAAGARGAVIVRTDDSPAASIPGSSTTVTIPVASLSKADGNKVRAAGGPLAVDLVKRTRDLDGALDTGIISHEWGHVLTNRLVGNANGLNTNQSRGMGEGWGDFVALLTLVRAEDIRVPANANWNGTYATGGYAVDGIVSDGHYFGIRRVPYSTDFTKNGLTFKHISNGVPLPNNPLNPDIGGSNAEVHNTGEIWCTMLWEVYAAFLKDTARYDFAGARQRMQEYLVAGLKLTPVSPTFVEARDGMLAAARARNMDDFRLMAGAFARRGIGAGAVAPARSDGSNSGVVESYSTGAAPQVVSVTLDDSVQSCDNDGVLDNFETGLVTVTIRNVGWDNIKNGTAHLTSSSTGLSFPDGDTIALPALAPFATATFTVKVGLRGARAASTLDLNVALDSDDGTVAPYTYRTLVNSDKAPSTTDTMTATPSVWAADGTPAPANVWQYVPNGGGFMWSVKGTGSVTTENLVSPPLKVAATGSLVMTVSQRFRFESNYDFGYIDISNDDGATWTAVGTRYTNASPSYPSFGNETIDFGTGYANQTVKVRFRSTSDVSVASDGWDIQQVGFTGITNKPFAGVGPDLAVCGNTAPVATASVDAESYPGQTVTLVGSGTDADNDPLSFQWKQLAGPTVAITGATEANASFVAPAVTQSTALIFQLTVNDGSEDSTPAYVATVVRQVIVVPPGDGGTDGGPDSGTTGGGTSTGDGTTGGGTTGGGGTSSTGGGTTGGETTGGETTGGETTGGGTSTGGGTTSTGGGTTTTAGASAPALTEISSPAPTTPANGAAATKATETVTPSPLAAKANDAAQEEQGGLGCSAAPVRSGATSSAPIALFGLAFGAIGLRRRRASKKA